MERSVAAKAYREILRLPIRPMMDWCDEVDSSR
jgi:hypothetical protein